jgi:hypothetical protein
MYGFHNLQGLMMNNPLQRVFANQNENFNNLFAGASMTQFQKPIVFQNNNINLGINIPHQNMCSIPNNSFMVFFNKIRITEDLLRGTKIHLQFHKMEILMKVVKKKC